MTIIYFIIALGLLVLVHEWGHFIIARRAGIRVEKFSIGFGPRLFSFTQGGTEFLVAPIPLGGYVKLYGEDPAAESEGDEQKAQEIASSQEAFANKPVIKKLATVLAGPGMNLILAFVLMPIVFMVGRQVPAILEKEPVILGVKNDSPAAQSGFKKGDRILAIHDQPVATWTDVMQWILVHPDSKGQLTLERGNEKMDLQLTLVSSPYSDQKIGYAGFEPQFFWGNDPKIGEVSPNSPAARAGFKAGDLVLSINDTPVESWLDMSHLIRGSEGKEISIMFQQGQEIKKVPITPEYHEGSKTWVIGITRQLDPQALVTKRYSFVPAIREGIRETMKLLSLTGDVLRRLFTFQLSYKALGGPIQIAQASGAAAESGLGEFLYFLAFLSLQLGVLNLLPIPVLDGGHVLFMALEGVCRKPLSMRFKSVSTQIGFALLMGLMLLITVHDIDRLWGFSKIFEKVRGIF